MSAGPRGGGFLARLDQARTESKRDELPLSPSLPRESKGSDLLEKATEYLFDIFDANMMEEYHIINNFEERAILAFPVDDGGGVVEGDRGASADDDGDGEFGGRDEVTKEITFEQERLHNEFLGIFEDLIERFLRTEGVSSADFFEQVRESYHGGRRMCQAIEVVDVIFCYTDIGQWHSMMTENARQRKRWEAHRKTALQEAVSAVAGIAPFKNKETHRLDDK